MQPQEEHNRTGGAPPPTVSSDQFINDYRPVVAVEVTEPSRREQIIALYEISENAPCLQTEDESGATGAHLTACAPQVRVNMLYNGNESRYHRRDTLTITDARRGVNTAHMADESIAQHKTYKYRLYPTVAQVEKLETTLDLCRELYNAGVQERRDAYRLAGKSVKFAEQCEQLPEIKGEREDFTLVFSQVLQDVLHRVDRTFKGFFRRVKRGETPGYPRFKPRSRYESFTYPQSGFSLKGGKLHLSKIGDVKIKLHRPIEGQVKQLTIKREAGRWYACFSVECEPAPLPGCDLSVGIDVGLTSFATLDDGRGIDNPRWYKRAQDGLRRAARKVARRKKGSHRRRKAVQDLQRIHAHIRNQRADFHHKEARKLVNENGLIVVEDLNVKGLASGMLAKPVNDAGWSAFICKLANKAEEAGRQLVKVNPSGTSQNCLCGTPVPKTLKERWHQCPNPECGLSLPRDVVSAKLILRLGLSLQALTVDAQGHAVA